MLVTAVIPKEGIDMASGDAGEILRKLDLVLRELNKLKHDVADLKNVADHIKRHQP
jgi:hypothetical protein